MNRRVSRFVAVGAIGFVLQLGALALLTMVVGWPYAPATAIAVELAVLHNFWWHERWTWRDRIADGQGLAGRVARYHVTTGATSIVGNLIITGALVELLGLHAIAANILAVIAMSVANFMVSDRWVFVRGAAIAAATIGVLMPSHAAAAELRSETIAAWNQYVAQAERDLGLEAGTHPVAQEPRGQAIGVAGGTIHRWRGSTLIPGVTVDQVVKSLMNPGIPPPQEDLLEARVLARTPESLRLYLKLVRRTIFTVTYDTEHAMTFHRESAHLSTARSVATKIAEAGGGDHGFLWRLNSYWRYSQEGDAVRVDLESLSLSREVPLLIRPMAGPIISRVARESLTRTLDALRLYFKPRTATPAASRAARTS
jgi:putative flippase GtrA